MVQGCSLVALLSGDLCLHSKRTCVRASSCVAPSFDSRTATAAVKSVGESRPPRFGKYSITSESEPELAESSGGDSSSNKDEQFMQLLRSMGQERAFRMLEKLREFERRSEGGLATFRKRDGHSRKDVFS